MSVGIVASTRVISAAEAAFAEALGSDTVTATES